MELLRSFIFVPGNRANMLERARAFNADVVMVDLEDSVPPGEKTTARDMAKEWVPTLRQEGQRVMVRVNSLDTGLTRSELEAIVSPDLYGISLGKVESTWNIRDVDRMLSAIEPLAGVQPGAIKIVAWAETASSLVDARDIGAASPRVIALAFGAEDFTNDMGIERKQDDIEIMYPRTQVAIAARAAGVPALDTPFFKYRDTDGLSRDSLLSKRLGFKGKFAIHPSQIETINISFSPSREQLEEAKRIIEVYEEAERCGRASTSLEGMVVDVPVVRRARALLDSINLDKDLSQELK